MDASIVPAVTGISALLSGVYGGFRYGRSQNLDDQANVSSISANTVEMLQAQVQALKTQNDEKEHNLSELMTRVSVLESLVTQKAEVQAVHVDVLLVKTKVDLIAEKVGA